jgi:deaminated glutathione amidase
VVSETGRRVSVAAVQLSSGTDVTSNVATALGLVNEAADRGATYVQLPEYFNFLGPAKGQAAVAESIPGPSITKMMELAKARRIVIHVGSLLEKSSDATKSFNTSVLIDRDGTIKATYRKIHLFDIDVPDARTQKESNVISPGQSMVVANLTDFQLGMTICFDLRFPELYRTLAVNGATVLAVPAAFNATTGRAHWEILLRARAIENHAFVIAAAQVGTTNEGIATYGHSMIVGPWGDVLVQSEKDGPDVIVADIDVDDVSRRRSQIDVLGLRRPQVYDSPSSST